MTIKVSFNGEQLGQQWSAQVKRYSERQVLAVQAAARKTASEIEREGRTNIKAGGNFGSKRWQAGFRAFVSFSSRVKLFIRVTHAVAYWRVFEFGATIRGKPMLWIPLSFAREAQGVRARDYPGGLFRVNRGGRAPLLLSRQTGRPAYFGKTQVRIPRKWRLRDVVRREKRSMGRYYREALRGGR